jgi:hypothetical protein
MTLRAVLLTRGGLLHFQGPEFLQREAPEKLLAQSREAAKGIHERRPWGHQTKIPGSSETWLCDLAALRERCFRFSAKEAAELALN